MAYSTPAQVRQTILPSSDGSQPSPASHTAADMTDGELQLSIADADSIINGYIGSRYTTPVADADPNVANAPPHPIDFLSRTIAAYLATLTFRKSQGIEDSDPINLRYQMAKSLLSAVSTGKANLPIPAQTGDSSSVSVDPAYNPYVGDLWDVTDFSLAPAYSPALNPWASALNGFW